jgi:hypothetical protein
VKLFMVQSTIINAANDFVSQSDTNLTVTGH